MSGASKYMYIHVFVSVCVCACTCARESVCMSMHAYVSMNVSTIPHLV